jgi:hypothetical protein
MKTTQAGFIAGSLKINILTREDSNSGGIGFK